MHEGLGEEWKSGRTPFDYCKVSSRHQATDIETNWNKSDYCLTHPPPILSVLEVPPSPVFFIRPLATLELLSVWLELRCFRREEGGGCFLLHLCLHFHCWNKSRWSRHLETPRLSLFWSPLPWQDPDYSDEGLGTGARQVQWKPAEGAKKAVLVNKVRIKGGRG